MKSPLFNAALFIVVFWIVIPQSALRGQNSYPVPITLSVSNTAINRFLGSQWNSIQHSWTGYFYYGPYSISLAQPTIVIADNALKIALRLSISSAVYTGSFTITPTLLIPPTTINLSNVASQYADLIDQINAKVTDQYLRNLINDKLAPISWIVYSGKIFNAPPTSTWRDDVDIYWQNNTTLGFAVANNSMQVTLSPQIGASIPVQSFKWKRVDSQTFGLRIVLHGTFRLDNGKTDDVTILETGQTLSFTSATPLPLQAAWDADLQAYVADIYYSANHSLANLVLITTAFKITRGSVESCWRMKIQLGSSSTWTSQNISIVMSHAE